ncbi:unnamed protein product [Rotaria sp. Silwood2]|nr:unnamed protein product [Rotaria sp. Silwood2]CAF2617922.1 unnamed protein product [Rotaria sp. Silwood2]CAF3012032.1 unnamed protein product [Rotaria sp. Silwood2]CAF4158301.1 unnamed protein product [Rotaria sp. Silwood2]CAF4610193.1 unnamed protein product [Rotaria sp. Silwood2]
MPSSTIIDILKPIDYDEDPERFKSISIVIVLDTDKNHEKIYIPDGDIFYIVESLQRKMIGKLERLTHKHKIVICGNNELGFEHCSKEEIQSKLLTNATLTR